MKRFIILLLALVTSSLSLGYIVVDLHIYRDKMPTIQELEYYKTLLPREKDRANDAIWASRQGEEYIYSVFCWVGVEASNKKISKVQVQLPGGTWVDCYFDEYEEFGGFKSFSYEFEKSYVRFDEMKGEFSHGRHIVRVTYRDGSLEEAEFIMPQYDKGDFPDSVNGEITWNNNIPTLHWSTVAGTLNKYELGVYDIRTDDDIGEDFDIEKEHPWEFDTTFDKVKKGSYDCEIYVTASKLINESSDDSLSYWITLNSSMRWRLFKKPLPVYQDKVTKCAVTAGANDKDSIAFSGQLQAIEADLLNSDNITVTLSSELLSPVVFTFPINAASLKKGKFSSSYIGDVGESVSLKYDTKTHAFTFSSKKINLTGLSCPLYVDVEIGEYFSAVIEVDEDIVNGPKQPCPPQLIMGVEDSLAVLKSKVKYGKKEWTDSFTVSGYFTIDGDRDIDEGIVIELGEQAFTISGDKFTEKKNIFSCKKAVSEEGPLVDAKFDFDKCTFLITVKNAEIESGVVEFDIECFGHDLPEQDVEI